MKKIISISIIFLLLDIISKQIIVHLLGINESITIIKNFFSLTLAKNTGIAFSLLEGKIPFIIITTFFIICLLIESVKNNTNDKLEMICYALIIGGALGNLLDRIIYGYVIDFLAFKIFKYSFPIFNLADSFIVIGILIIVIKNMKEVKNNHEENSKRKNENR